MIAIRASLVLGLLFLLASPAAAGSSDCDPRSAREWATRCVSDRDSVREHLDDLRRFPGLGHIEDFDELRELLVTGHFGDDCRKALRQLAAAVLNLASGRLSGDCCVDHADGRERSLREALHRHADDCRARRNCSEALRFLRRINDSDRVHECEDRDDDGHHDRDDHDHGDWDRDRGDRDEGCCRPRSRGWWHRQCLGADRVHPTRGNSGAKGPGAHPHLSEEDRDQAIRRARRRLEGVCRPCVALDSKNLGGKQAKAEAEVAALALNWGAGYLEGCSRSQRMVDRSIRLLEQERWHEAWKLAHDGNHAKGLRRCEDDRDDDHHDGDEDDQEERSESKSKSRSKGKGQGKKK